MLLSDLPLELLMDIMSLIQTKRTKVGFTTNCVAQDSIGLRTRMTPVPRLYLVNKKLCHTTQVLHQSQLTRVRADWFYVRVTF